MGILALCKVMFSRIKPLVFTHLQWLGGKPAEDVLGKLCRGSIGIKENGQDNSSFQLGCQDSQGGHRKKNSLCGMR